MTMLKRVLSLLLFAVFAFVAWQTARTLTSNGDTALYLGQTAGCALLLAAALFCKGDRESA